MRVAEILFWLSALVFLHAWVLYPMLMALLSRLFPRPVLRGPCGEGVSVLIAAHNEAGAIERKLRSLIAADAGRWVREILVGSDGSQDGTAGAARRVEDARLRVIEFPTRRGKPSVLNDLMEQATQPIVVMTDARQELAPDALERLLAPFADKTVGVVSGELVFRDVDSNSATSGSMDAYWRLEKFIRKAESRVASVPGATGAFYAIRREFLRPIPADTLLDDVLIPMRAVEQGRRCLIEEGAIVWDVPSRDPGQESARKLRTQTGNVQLMWRHPSWWLPGHRGWFIYLSHKIFRLLSPWAMWGLAVSNAILLVGAGAIYRFTGATQAVFYALALLGLGRGGGGRFFLNVAGKAGLFVRMNMLILKAWTLGWAGRYDARWEKHDNLC